MLSIVTPIYNEEESLQALFDSIEAQLDSIGDDVEVIMVDDGSTDCSWQKIESLCERVSDMKCVGVKLRRNYGKASALNAGFNVASGDVIVTMDSDLQDEPGEIPHLLEVMEQGNYDLVSGWKQDRQDPLEKTLPSKLFNWTARVVTGVPLHDFNCGLKAYRKCAVKDLHLYGELHRFTPILVKDKGFSVGEVRVVHNKRAFGQSKFGASRYIRGLLDLFTVMAITRYIHRPGHLFGGMGLLFGFLGVLILGFLTLAWFAGDRPIGTRPLFFLGVLLVIVSGQFISLGLLGEMFLNINITRSSENMVDQVHKTDGEKNA